MTSNHRPTAALHVPDEAVDELRFALERSPDGIRQLRDDPEQLSAAVYVIARPVVAAELRRLVSGLCTNDALYLLGHAEEIDPDGGA